MEKLTVNMPKFTPDYTVLFTINSLDRDDCFKHPSLMLISDAKLGQSDKDLKQANKLIPYPLTMFFYHQTTYREARKMMRCVHRYSESYAPLRMGIQWCMHSPGDDYLLLKDISHKKYNRPHWIYDDYRERGITHKFFDPYYSYEDGNFYTCYGDLD